MHKKIKAFTLIELLVVIAIVGILTGFIFVSMNNAVSSAKDTKRQADLSTISRAIMEYMAQNNNTYPYTATTTACNLCNNDSCTNPCTGFYANIQPYLSNIPLDPDGSTYYTYTYSATPKFVLKTTLSNTYVYQYDSTFGFSTLSYSSTCTAATNAKVSCTVITISSTEEVCKCLYLSGDGQTTWTTPIGVNQVQYLVVGGGGAGSGGYNGFSQGGGGGGGDVLSATGYSVSGSISIVVGAGGAAASGYVLGNAGLASSFNGISAAGGKGGGNSGHNPSLPEDPAGDGGNCGDGVHTGGLHGNRNNSGGAAGGAGKGANGASNAAGGKGGDGIASSITGTATYYGGGGGGASMSGGPGLGGGGTDGSGGGAGGNYGSSPKGGNGVVIIRYTHP
jgi:prepilin-type N-terminal cleavage/methylation domain-containing protein